MTGTALISKFEAKVLDDSRLGEYIESIKRYNPRAQKTLGGVQSVNGEFAGGSPFIVTYLLNKGFLPNGAIERSHLESAVANDERDGDGSFVKDKIVDVGIALRTTSDSHEPNNELARRIGLQLRRKKVNIGKKGLLLPFRILEVAENNESPYGMVFDLKELSSQEIREAVSDLGAFKWNFQRPEGINCACIGGDRRWDSGDEHLGSSGASCRVVTYRGEATSQKIDEHVQRIAQTQGKYVESLTKLRDGLTAEIEAQK